MKVQEYIQEDGSNPYQKWFDDLDAIAAAKVIRKNDNYTPNTRL